MRFFLLLIAPAFLQAQLPTFEQFHVSEVFTAAPATPRLNTAFARNFGTAIREGAERGPNFAGRFAIVQWGCGSACIQMAVVDEKTGAVYRGPFATLDFSASRRFADGSDSSLTDSFEPLKFRKDSRLLAVRGCPEEDRNNCALFFYEWDGKKFRLLQKFTPPAPAP